MTVWDARTWLHLGESEWPQQGAELAGELQSCLQANELDEPAWEPSAGRRLVLVDATTSKQMLNSMLSR